MRFTTSFSANSPAVSFKAGSEAVVTVIRMLNEACPESERGKAYQVRITSYPIGSFGMGWEGSMMVDILLDPPVAQRVLHAIDSVNLAFTCGPHGEDMVIYSAGTPVNSKTLFNVVFHNLSDVEAA